MNELIQQLILHTGLNEEQARQVERFLKDNAEKVPGWLLAAIAPNGLEGRHGGLLAD